MTLDDACRYVASQFQYKARSGSRMHVMRGSPMRGDCDDFAITVLHRYYGGTWPMLRALARGRAAMWDMTSKDGELHCAGSVGRQWFDNWSLKPLPREQFIAETGHRLDGQLGLFTVLRHLFPCLVWLPIAVPIAALIAMLIF